MNALAGSGMCQRLAAILAADAAGYSRLMAGDDRATVAALDTARAVFRTQIEAQRGRVIDMAGDSVLAVFDTAGGAVSAALEVQRQIEALAASQPAERRMRFRIGVHLGDVIEKPDGTVYGDGVNIAARLQGLAEPGGITVSESIRSAVKGKVAASFGDQGLQQVKNIADPVHTYRLVGAGNEGPSDGHDRPAAMRSSRLIRHWLGITAVVVAAALGTAAWLLRGATLGAGVVPITMSVAVGAITAPAGDAAAAQMAQDLGQSLATGLSAYARHVRVVAVSRDAQATVPFRQAARLAGARYVVEGDLQAAAPQRALGLRLIASNGGAQVWAGKADLPDALATPAAQAAVRKVIDRVAYAVGDAEVKRVLPKPVGQLDAMEKVVRAYGVLSQGRSVQLADEGRKLLEEAQRLEPTLLPVFWMMEWPLGMRFELDPQADRNTFINEMDKFSMQAATLDPDNWMAWAGRSTALLLLGRWNAALEASDRAIRMDPYSARPVNARAELLSRMGRPAEALPLTEKAAALNGTPSSGTLVVACEAHLLLGAYDKAIALCERASGLNPDDHATLALLAAAQANRGDIKQAQLTLQAMLKIAPGRTIAQLHAKRESEHPEYLKLLHDHVYAGLRKAGLAEH